MTNTIKAIKVTADSIEVIDIDNTLESLQREVGGYIEVVGIPENSWFDMSYEDEPEYALDIICNDEGKLIGLEPSLVLGTYKHLDRGGYAREAYDVVSGTALIVGHNDDGDFISLTDDQIQAGMEWALAWHINQWEVVE